jgi:tRNA(Ile)-lysidine synthase
MDPLERRMLSVLRGEARIAAGSLGLVSVSGGPDSMALLHLLAALAPRLRLRLEVAHFDHGLRAEAGREAGWVRDAAHRLGLPFHLRVTRRLAALTAGVQAAARAWRREELERLAAQTGAGWIATGHQLDDQLETVLLKLLRGAHLSGLQGMDLRQGRWVRPVLHVRRRDLLAYLVRRGAGWLEDPSNASPRYKRNRVRGELLPLLDELAGGAVAARLLALERQSRDLAAWLGRELTGPSAPRQSPPRRPPHWIEIAGLLRLPPLAQGAALHRFIQQRLPGELEYARIEDVLGLLSRPRPGREGVFRLDLPGRRVLRRRAGRLWLERSPASATASGGG